MKKKVVDKLKKLLTDFDTFLSLLRPRNFLGIVMLGCVALGLLRRLFEAFLPCGWWWDVEGRLWAGRLCVLGPRLPAGVFGYGPPSGAAKMPPKLRKNRSFLAPRRARNLLGYSLVWVGTLGPRQRLFEPRILPRLWVVWSEGKSQKGNPRWQGFPSVVCYG